MIDVGGSSSTIKFVNQAEVYGTSYEDIPRRVPEVTKMNIKNLGYDDPSLMADFNKTIQDYMARTQRPMNHVRDFFDSIGWTHEPPAPHMVFRHARRPSRARVRRSRPADG